MVVGLLKRSQRLVQAREESDSRAHAGDGTWRFWHWSEGWRGFWGRGSGLASVGNSTQPRNATSKQTDTDTQLWEREGELYIYACLAVSRWWCVLPFVLSRLCIVSAHGYDQRY